MWLQIVLKLFGGEVVRFGKEHLEMETFLYLGGNEIEVPGQQDKIKKRDCGTSHKKSHIKRAVLSNLTSETLKTFEIW